jgi:hypothetical protein
MSCNQINKRLNRRVTLWRKDKIPYGTYYAYENLKYIFPAADININKKSPSYFYSENIGDRKAKKDRKAYIVISPQVLPDPSEINALMNFVGEGNQVFISSFQIGDSLLSYLKVRQLNSFFYLSSEDSLRLSVYDPVKSDSLSFVYPGMSADNYAISIDSQYTTVLGRDADGHPDFIRFTYKGGGAIYLQFAPMAFTNFFLLHKNNRAYYENVFSYLPSSVTEVMWDDYFRNTNKSNFSALQYIFTNQSLKWAFWLILALFLIIYLFESKRRQKLIPAVRPLQNSSLDFAKTIGRLYYQQKDNSNLVSKMIVHFLDHVRTKYNLSTSVLDDEFTERLSYKSGFGKQELKLLIDDIRAFQANAVPSDQALLDLNKKMESFYKQG